MTSPRLGSCPPPYDPAMPAPEVRALLFDVFGTVVDWRSGVAREGAVLGERLGIRNLDWGTVADAWRRRYEPSMEEIRSGRRPFVTLDALHRENLGAVFADMSLPALSDDDLDEFTLAWHRLDPWPDVLAGLARLRQRYILAPHSNGNVALIVDMAKRAGLPWDLVLGAEVVRYYKPQPESYQTACEMLALPPSQVMLVAAHHGDLKAARESSGMRTAFVPRPFEYGAERPRNAADEATHDIVALDFGDLASQLGC